MSGQNRLAKEKSPYLLQHAENPVDWYPWTEEAFRKASAENRPVFLSIGYSTCHWCHVMAHESFEDPEVARLLNDAFVCIKVDREERPDIDSVYMNVCQMLTGTGGWPLSVFLTPDKKPFYAGTYFPKESRHGRIGMLDLIPRIREIWDSRRSEVLGSAEEILERLKSLSTSRDLENPGEGLLESAYEGLVSRYDQVYGGFGFAPKFPTPHNLSFLLRWWRRKSNPAALQIVEKTLAEMRAGGIFDQIGFGFHRYSVDREWLVPHFEKMLYDQALIAVACIETFQATGKEEYRGIAEEIFAYVLRDLSDEGGAFYASEDADSEGEEGKFYLWTEKEIRSALPAGEAEKALRIFQVEKEGNFAEEATGGKSGRNILHLSRSAAELPREKLEIIRQELLRVRGRRIRPHRDDKILTDWNGLMIAAIALASRAFGNPQHARAAEKAARFILEQLSGPDGMLFHRYREGERAIPGHSSDYSFFIRGLIELHQATLNPHYLEMALIFNRYLLDHFWDKDGGGFFTSADNSEIVLVRMKEVYDGAIPSSNSVALSNLFRLSLLTGDHSLEEKGWELARAFSGEVSQAPFAYTMFMSSLDFAIGPSYRVTIAGEKSDPGASAMLQAPGQEFIPNHVVLFEERAGEPSAQVCSGSFCSPPAAKIEEMLENLQVNKKSTKGNAGLA